MGKEAKFVVRLTEEERQSLQKLISAPRVAKAKSLRAPWRNVIASNGARVTLTVG